MTTQEERLTTLEYDFDQFKAEATSYYQEIALQVTMTKGLTEDAVKRLMQLRVQVDKRFNSTDQQLAEVKQEVAGVKQDLGVVRQDLAGVKQEVAEVKQELAGVRQEVAGVQTTLAQILARLPEKP